MIGRYDFASEEEYRAAEGLVGDEEFQAEICRISRKIDAGDKGAILEGIYYCICQDRPVDGHIAGEFFNAYTAVIWHHHKSWDDVFGRPLPRGAQLIAARRHARLRMSVTRRVEKLVAAGEPIDKNMFDAIAEELRDDPVVAHSLGNDRKHLKIGGTLVGKIYAECKERWGEGWPYTSWAELK